MFGRVTVDGMKRAQAIDRLNEGRDRDDGAYCGGGRVAGCESGTASLIGKGNGRLFRFLYFSGGDCRCWLRLRFQLRFRLGLKIFDISYSGVLCP